MKAVILFFLNFFNFFIIVANTRAYTHGLYLWTALTDLLFCATNFAIIQRVSKATSISEKVGYALGGVVGAQVSILVTKLIYGV